MGRQIPFHATVSDCNSLLSFINEGSSVAIVAQDASDATIVQEPKPCRTDRVLILWKEALGTTLQRNRVRPEIDPYYRVPSGTGLELSPSILTEWDGSPGLIQGRIYTGIAEPRKALVDWFTQISRWIRRHWVRAASPGTYVGPDALQWYVNGGLLLPTFSPPISAEWQKFFYQQESQRKTLKLISLRSPRSLR
jgi:hypothetical protein